MPSQLQKYVSGAKSVAVADGLLLLHSDNLHHSRLR